MDVIVLLVILEEIVAYKLINWLIKNRFHILKITMQLFLISII